MKDFQSFLVASILLIIFGIIGLAQLFFGKLHIAAIIIFSLFVLCGFCTCITIYKLRRCEKELRMIELTNIKNNANDRTNIKNNANDRTISSIKEKTPNDLIE